MRIIQNTSPIRSHRPHTASKNQSVGKSTVVVPGGRPPTIDPAKKQSEKHSLISRDFLLALADDYKNGRIDGNEANNRLVTTVVHNSIDKKLSEADKKRLIDDIADFVSQDQDFLRNLEKNLSGLT